MGPLFRMALLLDPSLGNRGILMKSNGMQRATEKTMPREPAASFDAGLRELFFLMP